MNIIPSPREMKRVDKIIKSFNKELKFYQYQKDAGKLYDIISKNISKMNDKEMNEYMDYILKPKKVNKKVNK